jgi:hypothetical protein
MRVALSADRLSLLLSDGRRGYINAGQSNQHGAEQKNSDSFAALSSLRPAVSIPTGVCWSVPLDQRAINTTQL